ncbi:Metallo-dependent hydrolase [Epithele typhae]|uniref:Metallo-dependent hydrolase n=1 Tax=Epithele typhae TaxID=378194 RepID=UPI0020078262|nr:Metallo-dependent hydrolase [Epithele typhae]KAH9927428.1 Metallo-dependent hydrolase [Epithele typhae]
MSAHDHQVAGPAGAALASLTHAQLTFLQHLPKAELHAHLNGSIPLPVLQSLAASYAPPTTTSTTTSSSSSSSSSSSITPEAVHAGIAALQAGVVLAEIDDFFGLFPAIYALTATPAALARAAAAVLAHFLEPAPGPTPDGAPLPPQAAYLELRSTPRATPTRAAYLDAVLAEVERYPPERAALVVSLDRRMAPADAAECVALAVALRRAGRRVVGVDLCGTPTAGTAAAFKEHFAAAKAAGLGVTLHIAEIPDSPAEETLELLSFKPDRLGHATFLDAAAKRVVRAEATCVEICLSSNLVCKTVPTLDAHHLNYYLEHNHPVAICTDDILPFRNSLMGEYALLLAERPLGLGLSEADVEKIAKMGMDSRFQVPSHDAAEVDS